MIESLKRSLEKLFSNDYSNVFALVVIFLLLLIGFIIIFKFGASFIYWLMSPSETPFIFNGSYSSHQTKTFETNPNSSSKDKRIIVRSKNQSRGIEFTWSTWIYVDGYDHGDKNNYIHIFNKGEKPSVRMTDIVLQTGFDEVKINQNLPKTNAPGAYLFYNQHKFRDGDGGVDIGDKLENPLELRIIMDTMQTPQDGIIKHWEEVRVPSFPINKWVHVVIRCMNHYLDVYINGRIKKRHILQELPRQNYGNIQVHQPLKRSQTGVTNNIKLPGNSKQADLRYFAYALDAREIEHYTEKGPNTKPAEDSYESGSKPYYLHQVWHFKDYIPSVQSN